jgi:hypothetical protein
MTESVTQSTKKAGQASGAAVLGEGQADVSREQRRRMIAEAAYYRAEQRGFSTDDTPEHDWLLAEQEVDALLAEQTPAAKSQRAH